MTTDLRSKSNIINQITTNISINLKGCTGKSREVLLTLLNSSSAGQTYYIDEAR